jgi:hypothetical protein
VSGAVEVGLASKEMGGEITFSFRWSRGRNAQSVVAEAQVSVAQGALASS